uniref:Glyoxalase domain-containing protein 4 n=1 Tax=Octopus bimaculoides TaxID=37653 RepID=A0A0L8H3G2_OCTBM
MSANSIEDESSDFVGAYRIGIKRPLHFVFKIANRKDSLHFFHRILGMKVLRHEEFVEGCKAYCNGPYDGRWSKTMIGYGSEDNHFVMELTYNYNIGSYHHGNDFWGITIFSNTIMDNVRKNKYSFTEEDGGFVLKSPDGYKFLIMENKSEGDPVKKVTLCVSDLVRSIDFWSRLVGMAVYCQSEKKAELGFDDTYCNLELIEIAEPFDRGTAYGRIAFAVPRQEVSLVGISFLL